MASDTEHDRAEALDAAIERFRAIATLPAPADDPLGYDGDGLLSSATGIGQRQPAPPPTA